MRPASPKTTPPTEGKMLVSKNDKYGVIDIKGNTIVKTEYDKILSDGYYTEKDQYKKSGFIVYVKTDDGYKCGYISYKGKTIFAPLYTAVSSLNFPSFSVTYVFTFTMQLSIFIL